MRTYACTTSVLLAVAISLTVANARAQDAATPPSPKKATTLEKVVVTTGTRSFDRTEVDSLAPIDVLTSKDIKATGAPNLSVALRMLLPSINFAQPSNVDATEAVRPVQLRGLSPDESWC